MTTAGTTLRVRDLMTREPVALERSSDLASAHEMMQQRRIRHLPVVDGERLVGLLSHRDLLRHSLFEDADQPDFLARLESTPVGDIMIRGVATVEPETDIRTAAQTMLDHKYGCLPVVEKGRLVGILTEADFVRLMAEGDS